MVDYRTRSIHNLRPARLFVFGVFAISLGSALLKHYDVLDELLLYRSDSLGYYQFLPGALIHGDLHDLPYAPPLENGRKLSIFTMGVAMLQLPFFLMGHVGALLGGYPADGYSSPYAIGQFIGAATYLAAALWLVYSSLIQRHTIKTALLTVSIIYLGTNLYYYTALEAFMSHGYSFFLFAVLLRLTRLIEQAPRPKYYISLYPIMALIVLVRPLNGVVLLYPLLANTRSLAAVHARILGFLRPMTVPAIGLLMIAALVLPQLIYWHTVSGKWLLFTYGTKGESFDFSAPHLFDLLISHQNGWFIYTPIMLAAMGALIWQARERGNGARTTLLVWGMTWYLYGSWWAWWLGGAFGYRGFIEYTALMAPPLAAFIDLVRAWAPVRRHAAMTMAILLIFLNLRLSALYYSPWDGPDWTWARLWSEIAKALYLR